jgi:hypothetical protein
MYFIGGICARENNELFPNRKIYTYDLISNFYRECSTEFPEDMLIMPRCVALDKDKILIVGGMYL